MTAPMASGCSGCRVGPAPVGEHRLRRTPGTDISRGGEARRTRPVL